MPGRRLSARRARPAVEAAAAAAVPRHPAGLVDRARVRGRRARPRRRRGGRGRARRRRARRSSNTVGFARREVVGDALVEAAPFGAARVVEPGDEVRVDGLTLENAHLRVTLSPDGSGRVGAAQGERPRGAGGARQPSSSSTRTARSPSTPGTSTPRRSRRGATSRPRRRGARAATPLRAEITFERPWLTQVVRLDAGSRRARVPHDDRLARGAHAAEGLLPARRARAHRDLRDAVRLRRAADALVDELGSRALRGARPPLGRPLRARLRRRAPERLQVRLELLRQRAAPEPAALAAQPRSRGRHRPARVRLRAPAACRRLARGRRRGRGGVLQRAAARDVGRRCRSRSPRSTIPNLVLDTIKRAEDSDALVLRLYEAHGARGSRASARRRAVLVGAARERRSRTTATRSRSRATRARARTGRTRSSR